MTEQMPARNSASAFSDMSAHHVAIRVRDFDAAKAWYVETLDFRVVREWPSGDKQLAYLALPNDDSFMIELLGEGEPSPVARPDYEDLAASMRDAGYHHFCVRVTNMDATVAELKNRGVAIVAGPFVVASTNHKRAFFSDPFGNLIELAQAN